jgi:hypothetical protein
MREEKGQELVYEVLKDMLAKEEYERKGDEWFREQQRQEEKSDFLRKLHE